jgi:hypothetical protein
VSPERGGVLAVWKDSATEKRYKMAVENSYFELLRRSNNPGQWEAYDGVGNHYIFNRAYDSEGKDCTTNCVRWYLGVVEDVDQNVVRYVYRPQGRIEPYLSASALLLSISYNYYDPSQGDEGKTGTQARLLYEEDLAPTLDAGRTGCRDRMGDLT